MVAVGVQRKFTDADDGIEVYLAVDMGVYLTGAAGFAFYLGFEADDVHVEDHEAGYSGEAPCDHPEGLSLVSRAVDKSFIG